MNEPCYRFYPERISENVNEIRSAFGKFFPDFILAYSFKTNSHQKVIDEARRNNLFAEVVSSHEYELAVSSGYNHGHIIYNGVCKDREQLYSCASNNGIVNIDNEEELSWCEEFFEETGKILEVGLRLNFDVGNGIKSRFGISVGSGLYKRAVELDAMNRIRIKGLGCHFTMTRESSYWSRKANVLAKCSNDFRYIDYLDFGGSLAASYEKTDARKKNDKGFMDFFSVAESLYEELKKFGHEKKRIIIESGTAVVGSSFEISSNVLHIKENGFIILDVSFMDALLPSLRDSIQFEIIRKNQSRQMLNNFIITGYTCLENDIIKKGFNGKLSVGDEMVFRNVGAYTFCFANNFIKKPLEIL